MLMIILELEAYKTLLNNRLRQIINLGPKYGYFPNAEKTCLVVKKEKECLAKSIFEGTNIKITTDGDRHLGAAIGSQEFRETYVEEKVDIWKDEVMNLSKMAITQPHAAYTAFTFGLKHKWTYVMRTIPGISELLKPLEECISQSFIPAITNNKHCKKTERDLLALPPRLGGLGIINPTKISDTEFENSKKLTNSLKSMIILQDDTSRVDGKEIQQISYKISKEREMKQKLELDDILNETQGRKWRWPGK